MLRARNLLTLKCNVKHSNRDPDVGVEHTSDIWSFLFQMHDLFVHLDMYCGTVIGIQMLRASNLPRC